MPLDLCTDRISAGDLLAPLSYPSGDVSLKDGFAVVSGDVRDASRQQPVRLRVIGSVFAGSRFEGEVTPGYAVRICSGAPIPRGADAVVSEEFCREEPPEVVCIRADAQRGRNVLRAGGEIEAGALIVKKGEALQPGYLGLAAAAGVDRIEVYRRPRVAVVAVGDEVVAPGMELRPGQLYASNLVTMVARLNSFNLPCTTSVVKDDKDLIKQELSRHLPDADTILTSGGAWGSERDLVIGALDELGWQMIFHHVRLGPGKGVAFGLWDGKPVFCLPGGPASNEMAFLQLALPGVLGMSGDYRHPLRTVFARLTEDVKGRHPAWTEFKDATLSCDAEGNYSVKLYRNRSRLQAIASANGLVCVPEGAMSLNRDRIVPVQVLAPLPG
jgi:molybdopterin molybdotransferase